MKCFSFGPFGTNTYIVCHESTCTIIDCAAFDDTERDMLVSWLDRKGLTPELLLFTHGHLDHVWGAQWACRRWGLTAYVHPNDFVQLEHLARQQEGFGLLPRETDFPYADIRTIIPFTDQPLSSSAGHPAPVWQGLHTPGHTQGSICLYRAEDNILFSGDTLFDGGYGRTDLPGGNYMQLMDSLDHIASVIPAGTTVYPGHGASFRL